MKRANFLFAVMLMFVATMTTSCLGTDSDNDNTYTSGGYCTMKGTFPNYTLYFDDGDIVKPTATSVSSLSSTGFGSFDRAIFYYTYDPADVTTDSSGNSTVSTATLTSGQLIPTGELLYKDEADSAHVTDVDSVYYVNGFNDAWVVNGYLTVVVNGNYIQDSNTAYYPDMTLVYTTDGLKENAATLHMYYNRHDINGTYSAGSSTFPTSFKLDDLYDLIPGTSENISLTIEVDGDGAKSINTTRTSLRFKM